MTTQTPENILILNGNPLLQVEALELDAHI